MSSANPATTWTSAWWVGVLGIGMTRAAMTQWAHVRNPGESGTAVRVLQATTMPVATSARSSGTMCAGQGPPPQPWVQIGEVGQAGRA